MDSCRLKWPPRSRGAVRVELHGFSNWCSLGVLEKTYLVGKIFSWISQTFIAINFVFLPKNFHFLSRFSHFKILYPKIRLSIFCFRFFQNSRLFFFQKILIVFWLWKKAWHKIGLLKKWNNGEPDTRYNNNGSQVQERIVKSASELSLYIHLRKSYCFSCTKFTKTGLYIGKLPREFLGSSGNLYGVP